MNKFNLNKFILFKRRVKLVVEPLDKKEPCSMCPRCEKEMEENVENPYNLMTKKGTLDLKVIKVLETEKKFYESFSDESVLEDEYFINFDCTSAGCEIGFAIEVTVKLNYRNVRWFL